MSMPSYKCIDGPPHNIAKEFPTTKGNQGLKRAMNKSQVFSMSPQRHAGDDLIPLDFICYNKKPSQVHNMGNPDVQNRRLKNYASKVF